MAGAGQSAIGHRDGSETSVAADEAKMMSGFGNHFATEAVAGALPQGRNSP